jgi:hypothetical protein
MISAIVVVEEVDEWVEVLNDDNDNNNINNNKNSIRIVIRNI